MKISHTIKIIYKFRNCEDASENTVRAEETTVVHSGSELRPKWSMNSVGVVTSATPFCRLLLSNNIYNMSQLFKHSDLPQHYELLRIPNYKPKLKSINLKQKSIW